MRRPFAIIGDLPGQRLTGVHERFAEGVEPLSGKRSAAGGPVGHEQHGVVGARVAIHAHAVEGLLRRLPQEPLGIGRPDRSIGEDDAKHCRHPRTDHRRALGHAEERVVVAIHGERRAGELGTGVGRHHAPGRSDGRVGIAAEFRGHRVDAGLDFFQRQELPNDAGREHEGSGLVHAHGLGGGRSHRPRIVEATPTGAGVGVARIDGDHTEAIARRAAAVKRHRCRKHEVCRVDARGRGIAVRHDQRDVLSSGISLQAGVGAGGAESPGQGRNRQANGCFSDGHGFSRVMPPGRMSGVPAGSGQVGIACVSRAVPSFRAG